MPEPIFLVASQRSGTNYLRFLLQKTGVIENFGEIFDTTQLQNEQWNHQYFLYRLGQIKADPSLSIPLENNAEKLFNGYVEFLAKLAGNMPFFLMDIKYQSLHHMDTVWQEPLARNHVFKLIEKNDYKVIHMVRHNLFEFFVSHQLALKTGKYHLLPGENDEAGTIEVDVDYMLRDMKRLEREQVLVRRFIWPIRNKIEIAYENMRYNPNSMPPHLRVKLSEFLGYDLPSTQQAYFRKIIKDPFDVISNKQAVRECLLGSRFSRFIESP